MNQWWVLACAAVAVGCGSCAETVDDLSDMLAANLKAGAKSAGHPTQFKTTLKSFPIGPEPVGDGKQFDQDDFSHAQWDLRPVTPNL